MRRQLFSVVSGLILILGASTLCRAAALGPGEDPGGWNLTGATTVSAGYYSVSGDPTASPYRFDGWQTYGQVDLVYERRSSNYRSWRAQLLALVNDSDYRSEFDGLVPERLNFTLEDGTAHLPYRLEFGDSYGYFSQRTVQRPIKGFQFELQSQLGSPERRQSLQFLSGSFERSWRDWNLLDSYTNGVSWLVHDPKFGNFSISYLDHIRSETEFLPKRRQHLIGAMAYVPIRMGGNTLALQGEVDYLKQRYTGDGEQADTEDEGYFTQVSFRGRSPLSARLRYEKYGLNYAPAGSPVIPDRRIAEAHLGWRLPTGAEVRGRYFFNRNDYETDNPLNNRTAGVILAGPLNRGATRFVVNVDFFHQDLHRNDRSTDAEGLTLDAELRVSHKGLWTPRARLFWQDLDDRATPVDSRETTELHMAVGRAITWGGFTGIIEPGLLFRNISNGADSSDDWQPTLLFNIARGGHSLVNDLGFLRQNRLELEGADVDLFTYRLLYRYNTLRNQISFEFDTHNRDPLQGEKTDSYRVAGAWTFRFDTRSARPSTATRALLSSDLASRSGPLDIAELVPGSDIEEVIQRLQAAQLGTGARLGNVLTYDAPVTSEIHQRQRLTLIERKGVLIRSGLVISPDAKTSPQRFLTEFERIRQIFVNLYGPATNIHEEGVMDGNISALVNSGRLIRIMEWYRNDGSVLRFGIPRRLDGALAIELQSAADFPQVRDTLWSISDARR